MSVFDRRAHVPSRARSSASLERTARINGEIQKGHRRGRRRRHAGRVRSPEGIRRTFRFACICGLLAFAACRRDMYNQPKGKPLAENSFFKNDAVARPLPPHTVARGQSREDTAFYTGLTNGTLVTQLPMKLTPQLLARGRERYDIYCAVCHGLTGEGDGEIVRRGFPAPPTYHVDRLRNAPIGHFYDVMTNGYGVMYPYATRVAPADRWAIAAYIRALQLSHDAGLPDVPPNEQSKLEATP